MKVSSMFAGLVVLVEPCIFHMFLSPWRPGIENVLSIPLLIIRGNKLGDLFALSCDLSFWGIGSGT